MSLGERSWIKTQSIEQFFFAEKPRFSVKNNRRVKWNHLLRVHVRAKNSAKIGPRVLNIPSIQTRTKSYQFKN